jgi:transcriptional regulator with GAF, ATPase, and Fis domain
MATLNLKMSDGRNKTFNLVKRLTTIGRGPDNDIQLEDARVAETAFHLAFDGHRYQLGAVGGGVSVNGKRRDEHALSSEDVIRVGDSELTFQAVGVEKTVSSYASSTHGPPASSTSAEATEPQLSVLRRLTAFSERLLQTYALDQVLEQLMDEAISLARADKGFLILLESNELRVKVARNLTRENIEDAVERVSDTIIAKVVKSRRPLIVSDALDDPEFKASESVVNLKLLSVMCVPLMHKGELFGLVYLGNDRIAHRFEQEGLDLLTIFAAQASLLLQNAMLVNELQLDNTELRKRLTDQRYGEMIGACAGMKDVYRRVDKVAPTDISVLITGETGTGKELIARELHRRSPRAKGPFVTINCGAIPENLLESELFGHVRGAFTGATTTKAGRFQAAVGGTLFLDELGEMPLALQVKLLRALQEKIVYRVGDSRGESVDIRVVAATNKVLAEEVKQGRFREDLFYRINTVTIHLPPLRERGEDITGLAKYFLSRFSQEFSSKVRGYSPASVLALKKYGWPGNIRELENRVKKAVVLADKPLLGPDDLDLKPEHLDPVLPLAQAKEEFQTRYINEVLERNNGNRTKTAKELDVDPRTIFRHLEKREGRADEEPA